MHPVLAEWRTVIPANLAQYGGDRMVIRRIRTVVVASTFVMLAACAGPGSSPQSERRGDATATPSSQLGKVDIDQIFPPGPGRDLVLNNCTSCHTFVPIVVLQMTKEAWNRNGRDHRGRVEGLSDAEFSTLYEYVIANFNPDRPVPKLPKELLDTWTTY